MNTHAILDHHVMLDDRHRTDADVIADHVQLADVGLVAGGEIPPDPVAGIDHGMRPDHGIIADHRFRALAAAKRRADDAKILDRHVAAEPHVGVNDSGRGNHRIPNRPRSGLKRRRTSRPVSIDS